MRTPENDDVISPQQAVTLHGLFLERVRRSPDKIAYRYFDNRQSVWVDLSWGQMLEQVARWQAALAQEGLAKGDRVALMLRNCPQWVMFDQAAMSLGLVVVPLYTVDRAENIAYIVNDCTSESGAVRDRRAMAGTQRRGRPDGLCAAFCLAGRFQEQRGASGVGGEIPAHAIGSTATRRALRNAVNWPASSTPRARPASRRA